MCLVQRHCVLRKLFVFLAVKNILEFCETRHWNLTDDDGRVDRYICVSNAYPKLSIRPNERLSKMPRA